MSVLGFIYPRRISVHRPRGAAQPGAAPQVGDVGYSGQDWSTTPGDFNGEDAILTDLPASIQYQSPISRSGTGVPTDTHAPNAWTIFVPKRAAALGAIEARDIVIDDRGVRYQVIAPYWNMLGHKLRVEEEERSN